MILPPASRCTQSQVAKASTTCEVTTTMAYQLVRTDNRGSAQLSVQASWLRREPWSIGSGLPSARAFMFFAQVRYNLP